MKFTPFGLTLIILLQSTISGSTGVFAQSGDRKPGDPINLGHVHKPYTGEEEDSNSLLYTPPPTAQSANVSGSKSRTKKDRSKKIPQQVPVSPSVTAVSHPAEAPAPPVSNSIPYTKDASKDNSSESSTTAHTPGKLRNALKGIGNVIQREGSNWLAPGPTSGASGNGSPLSGPAPSRQGLSGLTNGLLGSPNSGGYNPAYNPATSFFIAPERPDRSASKNLNPEGSLNFSSPVRARGPFNSSGSTALYRAQNWDGLLDYGRGWTEAQPSSGEAWFVLGEAAYKVGNYDAAVEGFRRATQYSTNEPKAWNGLSASYCKRQQWDLALKAVKDGEAASGGNCGAQDWYVFGNAAKNLQDYDRAAADYRKALAMRPNFPEAQNNLGTILQMNGDNAGANQLYAKSAAKGNNIARQNSAALIQAQRDAEQQSSQQSSRGYVDFGQQEFRRQTYQNAHPDSSDKHGSY